MAQTQKAPVDEVVDAVMTALREHGYRESTMIRYRTCLHRLRRACGGGDYTKAAGAWFAAQTTSPRSGMFSPERRFDHGRCQRLADSYLDTGQVDLSMWRKPAAPPASAGFGLLLAGWEADMVSRGLAPETRRQCRDAARRFLLHVEASGAASLVGLTGACVDGFLAVTAKTMTTAGLRSFTAALRPFLKFTGSAALAAAVRGLRFERPRVVLPVLTDAETAAVAGVLPSDAVGPRDRAIVVLALTTGLRACDIVGLQLGDLDWRADRISLVQKKTGNPLVLPLLPAVGNAISGYLLQGRPATADRHVFVRQVAPHVGLADHASVYAVMRRVFALAGLGPGRCGARLARHSVASKMLAAGTPSPTISAVLGHVDPASADRYLSTDADRLRSCVLALPEAALR